MATKKAAVTPTKFKNVSPFGDLDLPLLGRVVEHGEVIEVSEEDAKTLLGQDTNWEPVNGGGDK